MIERPGSRLHCCAHCRCSYRSFSWFQKLERSGPRLADSFCTAAERNSLPKSVGIGERSWNRRCTRPGAGNLQWPCCVIPIHGSTPPTKNRYRAFLQVAVPTLALASPEEERTNPEAADDGYESANSWLLAQTMDRERFRLQFAENINYGFRRNVWALRPWAFCLEAIAIVVVGLVAQEFWDGRVLDYISRNRRRIVGEPCVHPRTHILLRAQDPRSVGSPPSRGLRAAASGSLRCSPERTRGLRTGDYRLTPLEAGIAVANRGTYTPAIDARLSIGFEV